MDVSRSQTLHFVNLHCKRTLLEAVGLKADDLLNASSIANEMPVLFTARLLRMARRSLCRLDVCYDKKFWQQMCTDIPKGLGEEATFRCFQAVFEYGSTFVGAVKFLHGLSDSHQKLVCRSLAFFYDCNIQATWVWLEDVLKADRRVFCKIVHRLVCQLRSPTSLLALKKSMTFTFRLQHSPHVKDVRDATMSVPEIWLCRRRYEEAVMNRVSVYEYSQDSAIMKLSSANPYNHSRLYFGDTRYRATEVSTNERNNIVVFGLEQSKLVLKCVSSKHVLHSLYEAALESLSDYVVVKDTRLSCCRVLNEKSNFLTYFTDSVTTFSLHREKQMQEPNAYQFSYLRRLCDFFSLCTDTCGGDSKHNNSQGVDVGNKTPTPYTRWGTRFRDKCEKVDYFSESAPDEETSLNYWQCAIQTFLLWQLSSLTESYFTGKC